MSIPTPSRQPELVRSVFPFLPLEFQTVLETGLAAYFELAHCPAELEREGKTSSVSVSSNFQALALSVRSCWGTYFKENSLTFSLSSSVVVAAALGLGVMCVYEMVVGDRVSGEG